MKLLHTGDLHLGKSLHEHSLIEDQKIMLDQLVRALHDEEYAALVVAGDVYDRAVPSAEAVELFSSFLARIRRELPDLDVFIIPGNHDSSQRLSYANEILRERRIHIVCSPEDSFTPIITDKNGEKLALFLLPFLAPGTLSPGRDSLARSVSRESAPSPLEFDFSGPEPGSTEDAVREDRILVSQASLAREASRRFSNALSARELEGIPTVLVAHLFALHGTESGSERVFLGTAEEVDPKLFDRFSYVALGHLHRPQTITPRMRYSGSPLAYAFDEAGASKAFLKVDLGNAASGFSVTVTEIPVVPFRKVTRLSGAFDDFYQGTTFDAHAPDYLEITLTDDALVANPMNLLRPKFPWLLSLRQGLGQDGQGDGSSRNAVSDLSENGARNESGVRSEPLQDFTRFEELLYGFSDQAKLELFSALLSECPDET